MKIEKKKTCEKRRAQTRTRITLRAGIPDPGSFGSFFFGFAGAFSASGNETVVAAATEAPLELELELE
ncbi:MAG TPA: hypothetical protein VF407_06785, partial [Polyangiaceae bacterium]